MTKKLYSVLIVLFLISLLNFTLPAQAATFEITDVSIETGMYDGVEREFWIMFEWKTDMEALDATIEYCSGIGACADPEIDRFASTGAEHRWQITGLENNTEYTYKLTVRGRDNTYTEYPSGEDWGTITSYNAPRQATTYTGDGTYDLITNDKVKLNNGVTLEPKHYYQEQHGKGDCENCIITTKISVLQFNVYDEDMNRIGATGSANANSGVRHYIFNGYMFNALVNSLTRESGNWNANVSFNSASTPVTPVICTKKSADINQDGAINQTDSDLLEDQWGGACTSPAWCKCADINQDANVDILDYALLGQQWELETNPAIPPIAGELQPTSKIIAKEIQIKKRVRESGYEVSSHERNVVTAEKNATVAVNQVLTERLKGKILLQVESHGEAWYVDKELKQRFYLRNGTTAITALKAFGLGVSNVDIEKIPIGLTSDKPTLTDSDNDGLDDYLEESIGTDKNNPDSDNDGYDDGLEVKNNYNPLGNGKAISDTNLVNRLKGEILLQVEKQGQAWYVNPTDGKRYYMQNGEMAYQIMRHLSLGVTNEDMRKIAVGELE